MTTFEDMQAAWNVQNAKLDNATLMLKERVRLDRLSQIRTPLRDLIFSLRVEIVLCAVGMFALGGFLANHIAETRFVWPSALMDLWFCATLITSIRQLVAASRLNFDEPVALVQEQLAGIRILRLESFRWIFLSGQIVWWIPFAITGLRMFFGVDAYRYFSPAFIGANMLAGLVLIPLLLFVAKRAALGNRNSWYERLADVIAGHSLTEAQRQATALADFIR